MEPTIQEAINRKLKTSPMLGTPWELRFLENYFVAWGQISIFKIKVSGRNPYRLCEGEVCLRVSDTLVILHRVCDLPLDGVLLGLNQYLQSIKQDLVRLAPEQAQTSSAKTPETSP